MSSRSRLVYLTWLGTIGALNLLGCAAGVSTTASPAFTTPPAGSSSDASARSSDTARPVDCSTKATGTVARSGDHWLSVLSTPLVPGEQWVEAKQLSDITGSQAGSVPRQSWERDYLIVTAKRAEILRTATLLPIDAEEFAAGFLMDPVQYEKATAALQAGGTVLIGMVRQPPNGNLSARFAIEITDAGSVKFLEPCPTPVTPEFAEVARRRSMTEGQLAREVVRSGIAAQ